MKKKTLYTASLLIVLAAVSYLFSVSRPQQGLQKQEADDAYDVFVVAGQSNAYWGLGYDSVKDKPASGIYQLGRIDPNDMKVIPAREPLQNYNPKSDRVGFALTFAKNYQKEKLNAGRKILIVPCAMDNSGFEGDGWNKGNFLYVEMMKRINYVLTHYKGSKLKAILWSQGEKDANYKKYQQALDTFIVQVRNEIVGNNKNVPFIMGGMVPYWSELKEARIHQQKIIRDTKNRLPNIAYVDPYVPFKITKPDNNQDTVHYNADGQREMGKRYFEAYKKLMQHQAASSSNPK